MEKRILVAVDDSVYSIRAIEYATMMASFIKDIRFLVFKGQPTISEHLIKDSYLDKKTRSILSSLIRKNKEDAERVLEDCKSMMINRGIDEDAIETFTMPRTMGTAKDILNVARQHVCDAILLGRRGLSKIGEAFSPSVSTTVIENSTMLPVWAVCGHVTSEKIALAIDGSASSLRAVDHICFMLEGNTNMRITLLHVTPKLRDFCPIDFDKEGDVEDIIIHGDKQCVENFFVHAKKRFEKAGISMGQLEIKRVPSVISVSKTIINEIKEGGYGTLVIGRSGLNESFFLGSVSSYCLNNISDCAICIVP